MTSSLDLARERASQLRKDKDYPGAAAELEQQLEGNEQVEGADAARLAKDLASSGEMLRAHQWALRVTETNDPTSWQMAAKLLLESDEMPAKRRIRIAILGTYTTSYFAPMLRLALASRSIAAEIHEGGYDQLETELRDANSGTHSFAPDLVLLVTHEGALRLEAGNAEERLSSELQRWQNLWDIAASTMNARVVQHGFVPRRDTALGHVAHADPLSRPALIAELNARLHQNSHEVAIVDCAQIAASIGHDKWFDDRYWFLSKLAVSLGAHPLLAQHTAAVIAAQLGLSKKCIVLDLDDTLWGGLIGEDGIDGIRLDGTPNGEAHLRLQRDLLELKNRGIVLAVCSKNEHKNAVAPFERHPDMLLKLSDFASFKANWQSKADNISEIAKELDLGLDSLVFIDDSPLERREIRRRLPEVDVITMPSRAEEYPETLRNYLGFETVAVTEEDRSRSSQYQAKAAAKELEASAGSLEDFYTELQLRAEFNSISDLNLTRVTQLIQKTNQFNLTTIRRSRVEIEAFLDVPGNSGFTLRLQDRYVDHGLIAVVLTSSVDKTLTIDTWVMSCRVIGRTVEDSVLSRLATAARLSECTKLRGAYQATAKNTLVCDLYKRLGFEQVASEDPTVALWEIGISAITENPFIASSNAYEPIEEHT